MGFAVGWDNFPIVATSVQVLPGDPAGIDTSAAGVLAIGGVNATSVNIDPDLVLDGRLLTLSTIPGVGSGGAGVSALSVLAGSTNDSGQVQATLTAVAAGVVIGVVAFGGGPLATAPKNVVCSLSAPTAGVAVAPVVGGDTYTTAGFTIRVYGPAAVTTGTFVIAYWVTF